MQFETKKLRHGRFLAALKASLPSCLPNLSETALTAVALWGNTILGGTWEIDLNEAMTG